MDAGITKIGLGTGERCLVGTILRQSLLLYTVYMTLYMYIWCVCVRVDVSGGYSSSILDAMRCALHTSKSVCFQREGETPYVPLSLHEVLYMATVGGASGENETCLLLMYIYACTHALYMMMSYDAGTVYTVHCALRPYPG